MTKKKHLYNGLRPGTSRVARWHLMLVLAYSFQIIAFDSGHLITADIVLMRWIAACVLLAVSALTWFIARSRLAKPETDRFVVWMLILVDIGFAAFNIYIQRGMASRGVILYVIPMCLATVLRSQSALITTALLSIASYMTAVVAYFALHFNEGYKLEIYGESSFYVAVLLIIAAMLWSVIRASNNKH